MLDGEIISADSRQVFRHMDIGTGKDLGEYTLHGKTVPHHLIDICEPGEEYSVYRFQKDFVAALGSIEAHGTTPILCGGTGMYIDSVIRQYQLPLAPVNDDYRQSVSTLSDDDLTQILASKIKLHNHTDTEDRNRLLRALEIEEYRERHPDSYVKIPPLKHTVIGIDIPRPVLNERIETRLRQRLEQGMVDEVQRLLDSGIAPERLVHYGLEYRHITLYLLQECTYQQMYDNLFTDIRHFAKRQMTWFRRMQRNGVDIHWIDGQQDVQIKAEQIADLYIADGKTIRESEKC